MLIKLSTFKFLHCNSHIKIYEKCYGKTSLGSKYLNQVYPTDFPTVTVGHSRAAVGVFSGPWKLKMSVIPPQFLFCCEEYQPFESPSLLHFQSVTGKA